MRRHLADARVECFCGLMLPHELNFGFMIEGCGCNPAIQPRHLIGLLQERLWRIRVSAAENVVSHRAQRGGNEHTGGDANSRGGGNSHGTPCDFSVNDARLHSGRAICTNSEQGCCRYFLPTGLDGKPISEVALTRAFSFVFAVSKVTTTSFLG